MQRISRYASHAAVSAGLAAMAFAPLATAGMLGDNPAAAREKVSTALAWGNLELEDYNVPEITYDGPPIEMVMTHHAPEPSTLIQDSMEPGAKVLEKMSNGKIKVTRRWGGVVHGAADGIEATRTGLSHYAPCFSNYSIRDFKLVPMLSLPGTFPNAWVAVAAVEDKYAELFRDEWERLGTYVSKYSMTTGYHILTKSQVRLPQDVQGMKMRSSGGLHGDALEAVGMIPTSMPISDVYPAFQRGVLDGVSLTDSAAVAFNIHELAEYRLAVGLNRIAVEYCVSPRFFDSLPADLQRVFNAWARQHAQYEAQIFYELGDALAVDKFKQEGVTLLDPTAEEQAQWNARLQELTRNWLSEADAKGLPATQTYNKLKAHVEEIADIAPNEAMQRAIDDPVTSMYAFK